MILSEGSDWSDNVQVNAQIFRTQRGCLHYGCQIYWKYRQISQPQVRIKHRKRIIISREQPVDRWFFLSFQLSAERVRAERVCGHARPALPLGGLLLLPVHPGRPGALLGL
jgi:hypothetical protein